MTEANQESELDFVLYRGIIVILLPLLENPYDGSLMLNDSPRPSKPIT